MFGDCRKCLARCSSQFWLVRNHKFENCGLEDEFEVRLTAFRKDLINAVADFDVNSP
jgi:hypothetical protein